MQLIPLLAELFPGIAALILGVSDFGWLKHLKRHAHDKNGG